MSQRTINPTRWVKKFIQTPTPKKIYGYSILIGIIAGNVAIAFTHGLAYTQSFFIEYLAGFSIDHPDHDFYHHLSSAPFAHNYFILIIPAFGAFLSALLVHYLAPSAKGAGTEALIKSFHQHEGRITPMTPFVKAFATILTIGSGGSAGKEGPLAQIGAGFGSIFSSLFKLGARARRTLLLAGTAGGLGAIFKAPFGGALTAIEVLYKEDFEVDSLIPCILSSATGYIVYCIAFGFERLFTIASVSFQHPIELVLYIVLGFICVLIGKIYVTVFLWCRNKVFKPLPIHPVLKPTLGGLFVGVIGFFFPEVLGSGFGLLQKLMADRLSLDMLELFRFCLIIAALKILTTSLTIGSDGSGGVFGPSLVIGALVGGMVGSLAMHFFPHIFDSHIPYIIVGMSAFFAGVANAPIATLVMVCELTGGYDLLPPLLIVSMITIIFGSKFGLFQGQPLNRFDSPAHIWNMNVDLLKQIQVRDILSHDWITQRQEVNLVKDDVPFEKLKKMAMKSKSSDFIVINEKNQYLGTATLSEIDADISLGLLAYDFMEVKRTVSNNDDLSTVVENLLFDNVDRIAVIENQKVIASLEYRTILKLYKENIAQFSPKQVVAG